MTNISSNAKLQFTFLYVSTELFKEVPIWELTGYQVKSNSFVQFHFHPVLFLSLFFSSLLFSSFLFFSLLFSSLPFPFLLFSSPLLSSLSLFAFPSSSLLCLSLLSLASPALPRFSVFLLLLPDYNLTCFKKLNRKLTHIFKIIMNGARVAVIT